MGESAEFRDTEGRTWRLDFNLGTCLRLKAEVGFDIGDLQEGKALMEMMVNPLKFLQLLWLLCEKQADNAGVDEKQFAESLGSDSLDGAFDAMNAAIVNFTRPHLRGAVKKVMEVSDEAVEATGKAMMAEMDENKDQIETMINTEMKKAISQSLSGNLSQS